MSDAARSRSTILGIDQSRYYGPDEMEPILQRIAQEYPHLATLTSIGESIRGRALWMMELTNPQTGPAEEKPGVLVFAMTHAAEIMGAAASLYAICDWVDRYGHDERITELLDQNVLYVMPFLNPDGGEIGLNTPYRWVGHARYGPGEEQPFPGLYQCDIDGDGRILEMRIEDPDGEWKASKDDPRLLVQRQPGDREGPFYRRLPEGLIRDYDGAELWLPKPRDGNLNRNFPENWGPEHKQDGAGDYPLSEPEVAAFVRFVMDRPNIVTSLSLHTNAGAFLFPQIDASRKRDLLAFRRLAKAGSDIVGYAIIESVLDSFTADKSKPRLGVATQWLYKQMGQVCYTVELWDWLGTAGVERESFMATIEGPKDKEQLQLLKWNDEVMNGEGFIDWYSVEHPQLGPVELGGWTYMWPTRNAPPGDLLLDEIHKLSEFMVATAESSPRLRVEDLRLDPVSEDTVRVSAVIANGGFLPTYGTEIAREYSLTDTIHVELEIEGGVLLGAAQQDLGHLAGWAERDAAWVAWNHLEWEPTKKRASWLVQTSGPLTARVTAQCSRAGKTTLEAVLPLHA